MTYLRLPVEGGENPERSVRSIFSEADWRKRYPTDRLLDIGETWQGMHYLITGDPWEGEHPAADVVCGGRLLTESGTAELGMDVIYLAPDRVKLAADYLADTSFTGIAGRYDAKRMAALEIQGADGWAKKSAKTVRDRELRPVYDRIVAFFRAAASAGDVVYKTMA